MAVILPSVYKDGTATVNNGSTTVNGQNTLFINSVLPGDFFGSSQGVWVRIESVNANDSLTLSHPWPEASQTAAPYEIMLQTDNARMQETSRQLLETLSSGNNYSLGQLNGNVDQIPIFSAPGVFTLVSKNELLSGVNFDVIVNDMAGRAAFDNQNTGFTVLVIDIGDGRSAAYAKNSATPGDWSNPIYITGEQGESGPYTEITVGMVSTVPYGTPANVTATPVDEDTVALNFEIPAGMNGSGTGDMLKSVYDPQNKQADAFVRANHSGDVPDTVMLADPVDTTKRGRFDVGLVTAGQTRVFTMPDRDLVVSPAWEQIGSVIDLTGLGSVVWTNLAPFGMVRIRCVGISGSESSISARVSGDNGVSFFSGATDYAYGFIARTASSIAGATEVSSNSFPFTVGPTQGNRFDSEISFPSFNKSGAHAIRGDSYYYNNAGQSVRLLVDGFTNTGANNALQLISFPGAFTSGMAVLEGVRG